MIGDKLYLSLLLKYESDPMCQPMDNYRTVGEDYTTFTLTGKCTCAHFHCNIWSLGFSMWSLCFYVVTLLQYVLSLFQYVLTLFQYVATLYQYVVTLLQYVVTLFIQIIII